MAKKPYIFDQFKFLHKLSLGVWCFEWLFGTLPTHKLEFWVKIVDFYKWLIFGSVPFLSTQSLSVADKITQIELRVQSEFCP